MERTRARRLIPDDATIRQPVLAAAVEPRRPLSGADGKEYIVCVLPWLLNTIITELRAKGILLELGR